MCCLAISDTRAHDRRDTTVVATRQNEVLEAFEPLRLAEALYLANHVHWLLARAARHAHRRSGLDRQIRDQDHFHLGIFVAEEEKGVGLVS